MNEMRLFRSLSRRVHAALTTRGSRTRPWPAGLSLVLISAVLSGCGEPGNFEPRFHLNSQGENVDNFRLVGKEDEAEKKDKEFNIESRQYLVDALTALFGTPDRPFVFRESGLDLRKIRMASGPAGGLPQAQALAEVQKLREREAEVKKKQPEFDAEAKKREADITAALTSFATSKGLQSIKTPADLKDQEAPFREQYKSLFEAKAVADGKLAEAAGELSDLDLELKSYAVASKGLYRKHCAHCHGTSGDGAGPTAAFLVPYPRDYRQGIFKFKSTERAARPTNADLKRILVEGINDTAMPSFATLLAPDEMDAIIEYVKYLAIRGEAESAMKDRLYGDRKAMKPSRSELVKVAVKPVVDVWKEAESAGIAPVEGYKPDGDRTAWLKGGADLFMGDRAKCFSCHGNTGLGDGRKKSEPLYDIWNKDKAKAYADLQAARTKGDAAEVERLNNQVHSWSLPVQEQLPRNLRVGKYRFGRAPIDLYRRIYAGINGTEMPGGGPPTPGAKATLSEKEIWQLVDYVLSLPYELHTNTAGASAPDKHAAVGH
jgi:mono/diheme cytochrome c family protein